MPTDDERLKARARLALRAERAFGLNMVALPPVREAGEVDSISEPVVIATPRSEANLFGASTEALPARVSVQLPLGTLTPLDPRELSADEKRQRLLAMDQNEVNGCIKCRLSQTRTHTVFGEGAPDARIFFIGEGPGETEDRTGRPFVGKAGQLLDRMIGGMGLKRDEVFIANIVKCRPPGNREPAPDETATCTPYLQRQLEIVRPQVIVTLGKPAAQHMLQTKLSMSRMRGQWHEWRGIKLMPTFHPAYLLRAYTQENRAMVWSDLKEVMRAVGLKLPTRGTAE